MPLEKSTSIFDHMTGQPGSKLSARQASAAVTSLCAELDYDPLREMVKLAQMTMPKKDANGEIKQVPVLDAASRLNIAKEIMPYIAPKMKTVDLQGDVDKKPVINLQMIGGTLSGSGGQAASGHDVSEVTNSLPRLSDGADDGSSEAGPLSVSVKVPFQPANEKPEPKPKVNGLKTTPAQRAAKPKKKVGPSKKITDELMAEMEMLDEEAKK